MSLSPSGAVSSRLGEYHRAKQSPAVLDQFFSPSAVSSNVYKSSPAMQTNSGRFSMFSSHQGSTVPSLSPSRRPQTPLRPSLHPGRLTDQRVSPFGTSLVSLAVRGRLRETQSLGVSPVIVHLSNPSDSSRSGLTNPNSYTTQKTQGQGDNQVDPCDKDVVISALKQKRKRWACHNDDITAESQPAAKRSRYVCMYMCVYLTVCDKQGVGSLLY